MNGVISTQFEFLGKLARLPRKWSVDPHEKQFTLQRLELIAGLRVSRGAEPLGATGRGERRATLGIAEDAGSRLKPCTPQLGYELRSRLENEELDKRRGVEI